MRRSYQIKGMRELHFLNSTDIFVLSSASKTGAFRSIICLALSTILLFHASSCSNAINSAISKNPAALEDGFFLVERSGTKSAEILPLSANEKIITFNTEFLDKTDQKKEYLVVNTSEFVPLTLAEKPTTKNQKDNRKLLNLVLAENAKHKLKTFTQKHLNAQVAIVVNSEALTRHKIRSVIDGGQVQITRCTDNACEMLYTSLQDNIIEQN